MLTLLVTTVMSLICTRTVLGADTPNTGTLSDYLTSAQASATAAAAGDPHQMDDYDLFDDDDRGLTADSLVPYLPTSKLVIQGIIQRHDTYDTSTRNQSAFEGNSLAYVTPWNNHGYDVVKTFRGKFTHVSPVWYSLRGLGDHFRLDGGHDVDEGWMGEVREPLDNGFSAKILPRVLFAEWQEQDYVQLVQNPKVEAMVLERLVDEVLSHEFDGIVLEIASPSLFIRFITRLAGALRREMRDLILVIQPPRPSDPKGMPVFSREHFNQLKDVLAGFSLMTYDFSVQTPGPNSPLKWVKESVEQLDPDPESPYRAKIFTGLNFYGIDFTNRQRIPIIGRSFASHACFQCAFFDAFIDKRLEFIGPLRA